MGKGTYYGYAFFHQFLWDGIAYTWGAQVATADGKVLLNAPEVVDMMTFFRKMLQDDLLAVQPVLVGGFEEQNGAFISGKVASVFQTTSFTPTAVGLLKFDWQFAPLPAGKGGNAITLGGGNFAITSKAANPEAAAKFLQYITGPQIAAEFYMQTGNLPVRRQRPRPARNSGVPRQEPELRPHDGPDGLWQGRASRRPRTSATSSTG